MKPKLLKRKSSASHAKSNRAHSVSLSRWLGNMYRFIVFKFLLPQVWFVGQYRSKKIFEIQGIFSTKTKAIDACRKRTYFILPLWLNEQLPDKTTIPKNVTYPNA